MKRRCNTRGGVAPCAPGKCSPSGRARTALAAWLPLRSWPVQGGALLLGLRVRPSWRCTGGAFPWRLSCRFRPGGRAAARIARSRQREGELEVRPTARRGGACGLSSLVFNASIGGSPRPRGCASSSGGREWAGWTPRARGVCVRPRTTIALVVVDSPRPRGLLRCFRAASRNGGGPPRLRGLPCALRITF